MLFVDQLHVGGGIIRVRHHHIGREDFSALQPNPGGDPVLHFDLLNWRIQTDTAAHFLELGDHRRYHGAGAALGKMDAPGFFNEMDHCIDGRDLHRVAANQQRLKTEHLAHLVGFEIFADQAEQRLHRAQLEQIGHDAQHRSQAAEIRVAQL